MKWRISSCSSGDGNGRRKDKERAKKREKIVVAWLQCRHPTRRSLKRNSSDQTRNWRAGTATAAAAVATVITVTTATTAPTVRVATAAAAAEVGRRSCRKATRNHTTGKLACTPSLSLAPQKPNPGHDDEDEVRKVMCVRGRRSSSL